MSGQDWSHSIFIVPILGAAEATPNLNSADKSKLEGFARVQAKHKELMSMSADLARQEYDKLGKSFQAALKSNFGEQDYSKPEETSLLGNVWNAVSNTAMTVLESVGAYGEQISTPYRFVRAASQGQVNYGDLFNDGLDFWNSKAWKTANDGKTLFDKDKEAVLDRTYAAVDRFIAKSVASGRSSAEILADCDTEEELKAYERWMSGKDDTINNAIRDYNNAHISWGRDVANLMGLSPETGVKDQGIEGTVYNLVSGAVDLAGDVAFDPLTYIAAPLKAAQMARFGAIEIAKASTGSLSGTQKILRAAGVRVGADAIFEAPGVATKFDEIGALVKKYSAPKTTAAEKAQYALQIKQIAPQFDDNVVQQFAKYKVHSAEDAKGFFKNMDAVTKIFQGESGTNQLLIPRYKPLSKIRSNFAQVVLRKTPPGQKVMDTAVADNMVSLLSKGDSINELNAAKQIKAFTARHAKFISRAMNAVVRSKEGALVDNVVFVGGTVEGKQLAVKSAQSVYQLTRVFLPKNESNMIATAFVHAPSEGARRNILVGVYKSMADAAGIDRSTKAGQAAFDEFMGSWGKGVYSENALIDDELAKSGILGSNPSKTYNPGMVNGKQLAVGESQMSNMAQLPNLQEFAKLMDSKLTIRGISNTINHKYVTAVTDFWSALNLLPRLGLRTVIDENTFHFLTVPLVLLPKVITGYRSSIMNRIITHDTAFTQLFRTKVIKKVSFDEAGNRIVTKVRVRIPGVQQKDIGVFARLLRPMFTSADEATLRAARGNPFEEAKIVEASVTRGLWGRLIATKDDARYLAEHSKYNHSRGTQEFSRGVTQAQTFASRGVSEYDKAFSSTFNINVPEAMKELGVEFGDTATVLMAGTSEFKINMLIQIANRLEGPVGKIVVENIHNPKLAVKKIEDFLKNTPDGQALWNSMERSAFQSEKQGATDMFIWARAPLVDSKGKVNDLLIKKLKGVREDGSTYLRHKELNIEDIHDLGDKVPTQLLGYNVKTIPSHSNAAQFLSDVLDRGFQVADRQTATLSREPFFYAHLLGYRRKMKPLEEAFKKQLVDGGMKEDVAQRIVEKRFAQLGNDMALNKMLGYVDNPNVRSNVAFGIRNFARYYRATEDFWRRGMRVIKNHPEALVRLRLAMDGLDHAGFIHEDENGDKYFTMPVDSIVSPIYTNIAAFFGQKTPMYPMPLTLTGKIKMMAPSFDPESALPTFSSPLMSISWSVLSNMIPEEYRSQVTYATMGKYAEGRTLSDALMPSAVRQLWYGFIPATQGDMGAEQIASATLKAAAYYESVNPLPPNATLGQIEQRKEDIKNSARNVVAIRSLLGLFSPVTPTAMQNKDLTPQQFAHGVVSFKSEWNSLLEKESAKGNPDAYNAALAKFTRLYPGKLVYTVPEGETKKVAKLKYTKEAADWIKRNRNVVNGYPEGAMFLLPQYGKFDLAAYSFMKNEGYIQPNTFDTYFNNILNIEAENKYYDLKDSYQKKIDAAYSPGEASIYKSQWDAAKKEFLADKPLLKIKFESQNGTTQLKSSVLNDMRSLVNSSDVPADAKPAAKIIAKMIDEYDKAMLIISSVDSQSDAAVRYRKQLRMDAMNRIAKMIGGNTNAASFYDTVLKRLLNK